MRKIWKQNSVKKILSILMLGAFIFSTPMTLAQDDVAETNETSTTGDVLFEPVGKQIIQLADTTDSEQWQVSPLETFGLRFLVRGKEALTWSLNIEDGGFHNPAIETSYIKVLTIVNSLFILGLLAIALMWIFSILIPRKTLKKVILVYGLAVVFVNFALPLNRLFIDGTNLLQKTLLTEEDGSLQITDIVQAPAYSEAFGYENNSEDLTLNTQNRTFKIKLTGSDETTTPIGKIRSAEGEVISEEVISLNNKELSLLTKNPFNPDREQQVFRTGLILLTGLAYFIIALIFLVRIVLLWALLILSPMLLLLAIFRSTRGWFLNWLSLYGRWLLIGPLTALGIAIIVNIWQMSGLPISVSQTYVPGVFTVNHTSNILFYLPGKDTANTLSNTQEMMEYLVFLLMLYLPVFLGFALTRRKVIHESLVAVTKKLITSTQTTQQQLMIQQALAASEKEEEKREKPVGLVENFRKLVNDKVSLLAENAMPIHKLKVTPETPTTLLPTASNFLSENLTQTPVPKILELLGMQKDSKASRTRTIEKLAHSQSITDKKEREKVEAVRSEIERRAGEKGGDAMTIMHEIETIREREGLTPEKQDSNTAMNVHLDGGNPEAVSSININVNENKRESDRKVRDSSFDSKSEKKGQSPEAAEKAKKDKGATDEKKDEKKTADDEKSLPDDQSEQKLNEKPNLDKHAD